MSTGSKKVLGPFQLWGIAVGLVISGEYFGWSFVTLLAIFELPAFMGVVALGLGVVCLIAMAWFNFMLTVLFVVLMAAAYGYFLMTAAQRKAAAPDEMLSTTA